MPDATPEYVGQLSPEAARTADGFPAWLNLRLRSQATWAMLASAIVVGLLADQALRARAFGLAASLTMVVAALALAFTSGSTRTEPRAMIAFGAVFASWLTLRASPWLLWPDLAAALGLLGLGAAFAARGSLLDIGTAELTARALHAAAHVSAGAAFITRPLLQARRRVSALGPVFRGLAIGAPIAVLVSVLLASADPVFASFFNLNLDFGRLVLDLFFIAMGLLAMAGLFRLAASEPFDNLDGPLWRLGATEALVVLAVLDAVFAAFAIAQVLAATGAAADTLRSAGVTYADYARSGFFQLLWVSGITLVVLVVFSRITGFAKPEHKRAFQVLAGTAIALTLLIVLVAFRRLSLYEEAYGFTMLRLYSHIFAAWIAVVFLLLAADLAGVWRKRRWFVGAAATTALGVLLALNFADPEVVVVALNVNHAQATHKIDAHYFAELSSDATPALLDSAATLDPALGEQVARVACAGPRTYEPSLASFNWADSQAAASRRGKC